MTLGKCYVRNVYSNLKSRMWKHDMPCTSEKIIMAEVSGQTSKNVNVKNVFHNANSILYTAHPAVCVSVSLCVSLSLSLSPSLRIFHKANYSKIRAIQIETILEIIQSYTSIHWFKLKESVFEYPGYYIKFVNWQWRIQWKTVLC